MKFGDISTADFKARSYSIDTGAQAVVLYNAGTAEYMDKLQVIYKYHRRVRIMNKSGFPAATMEIPVFRGEYGGQRIDEFHAATYNIENGKVEQTKLEKESIFTEKVTDGLELQKFTFPNLKEGCIVEYTCTMYSPPYFNLSGWHFQEGYPVLESKFELTSPEFLNIVVLKSGYYEINPVTEENSRIFLPPFNSQPTHHFTWDMKDMPALRAENYTTTIQNYISKVDFQIKSVEFHGSSNALTQNWEHFSEKLLQNENFGKNLDQRNGFFNDDMKKLFVAGKPVETARNIFNFVRDQYSCTDYSDLVPDRSLRDIYHAKKGTVAEINILLTAMLRSAEIKADPVMLSTREHGFAYDPYPIINKFNYIITRAVIDDKEYLLDAARKKIGFNRLPAYCYNGLGHIINMEAAVTNMYADSLKEPKTTVIFVSNSADGKTLEGSFNTDLGYHDSYDLREKLSGKSKDEFFREMKSSLTGDISIKDADIDSLDKYDEPVSYHYNFSTGVDGDIFYYSPFITEGLKTNPFKADKRSYPVEMPHLMNERILITMDIPKGYKVEELPKSEKLALDNLQGIFEYIAQADDESIHLSCKISLAKATFPPEEYEDLREFFAHIVKKQGEQIVFKKK